MTSKLQNPLPVSHSHSLLQSHWKNPSPSPTPLIISGYGPKLQIAIAFPEGFGRTKQAHKAECDINSIMAKYIKTGTLDFARKNEPSYGDCVGSDFNAAMLLVARGKSMFHELPAAIRARFDNDPAMFLDFVDNPANYAEMDTLGLLKPLDERTPPEKGVPPADDVAARKAADEALRAASQRAPGDRRSGEFPKHGNDHARDPKSGRFADE